MLFDGPDHPAWETFDMEGRLEFIEQFGMSQSLDTVEGGGRRIRMWDDRRGGDFPSGAASSLLNFASNDFLDLATDDRVQAASAETARTVGTGASASRVITGDTVVHQRLERELAAARNSDRSLLFPSTYAANVGTLTALYPGVIFSDERNHASVVEASRMTGAEVRTYAHCDAGDLEEQLAAQAESGPDEKWVIVTESAYSMDADIAPLEAICDLAAEYGAWVVVDGAHACGLYENGGGIVQREGLSDRVDVQIGALSKALASQGGYVAGDDTVVSYLANAARTFLFSTALNPPAVAAARQALEIASQSDRPAELRENAASVRSGLDSLGFDVAGSTNIVPVMIGDPFESAAIADELRARGVLVFPVPYPAVPQGTSRIRVNPMATHTDRELDVLIDEFETVGREFGLL